MDSENQIALNEKLDDAINRVEISEVKALLKRGANPNHVDFLGWTPLMNAAWVAAVDIVSLLLKMGADPLAINRDGQTALALVRTIGHNEYGHDSVISILLPVS